MHVDLPCKQLFLFNILFTKDDHAMVQIRWTSDKANVKCQINDFGHLYSHTTDAASNWPQTSLKPAGCFCIIVISQYKYDILVIIHESKVEPRTSVQYNYIHRRKADWQVLKSV